MIAEARVALSKISLHEQLVHSSSLERYRADLTSLVQMDRSKADEYAADVTASVERLYGFSTCNAPEKSFVYNNGVAVIPVHGILLNRFNSCWGFATGYNFVRAQMNAADEDPDVQLIVFDHDSPGGDKAGCFELSGEIRELSTKTLAMIDDQSCSGSYALAAACDKVIAAPSSHVGSIGVYKMHVDVSGADAQMGLKYTYVFSGAHKVEGNPHEPLSPEVQAKWQGQVDKSREEFVADIAISRDMEPQIIRDTEAETYTAQDALAQGLVDAVQTPTQAVSSFLAELADDAPEEDEEDEMALDKNDSEFQAALREAVTAATANTPDAATIAREAVAADRTRRIAITSLDEAKDRPKLAATLADQDSMTAETAKVILASAAVEKAEKTETNGFREAMDRNGGAGVQTDEESGRGAGGDEGKEKAAGILQFVPKNRRVEGK